MTQGERVKEIRKTLDLTLEKFGEKLGVKKNSLSQIENGKNALTDLLARSICREYNVSYDYLMYGEGEMFDQLPQTILDELCMQFELDDLDKMIIDLYIGLSSDTRNEIKDRIKLLIERRLSDSNT